MSEEFNLSENDDQEGYELEMPFVVVKSVDGPYDDDSFAAGWQCGEIYTYLQTYEHSPVRKVVFEAVRIGVQKQLDLIAMKFGFKVTFEETIENEWCRATFTNEGIVIDLEGEEK